MGWSCPSTAACRPSEIAPKSPARASRTGVGDHLSRWSCAAGTRSEFSRGPAASEIPMNPSTHSELIRFARTDAGSTVIDVWPGSGDWTRLFSDIVGPEGRVYSFVPAEIAHFKSDPVGRMRALAQEPGRENVEVISADL